MKVPKILSIFVSLFIAAGLSMTGANTPFENLTTSFGDDLYASYDGNVYKRIEYRRKGDNAW